MSDYQLPLLGVSHRSQSAQPQTRHKANIWFKSLGHERIRHAKGLTRCLGARDGCARPGDTHTRASAMNQFTDVFGHATVRLSPPPRLLRRLTPARELRAPP